MRIRRVCNAVVADAVKSAKTDWPKHKCSLCHCGLGSPSPKKLNSLGIRAILRILLKVVM